MNPELESLLLEHFKSFKASQDLIERKLDELGHRIRSLETAFEKSQEEPHIAAGDGAHPDHRPDAKAILPSQSEHILAQAGIGTVPGHRD
ncbi:hypothetical protein [Methylovirgula sp. 4M-Z18]|uniref:hypothetical protein n=1 Tax=Methylovirgula sp. 4M-Z18 TaxID=2293567 RepID=UPI000E2F3823|nr:hypothetical protein [Methylovirgula sp. 4M-Z18]RFB78589.1 hypothetical protein DYH55_15380 [Methylovirgula sp. 4M-Z18]